MEEKIKLIIIIGLAAMLTVSVLISLQTYSSRKVIELERNELRSQNESSAKKIEEAIQERKELQGKINTLTNDLNTLTNNLNEASQQKQNIQNQYELIVKERDGLAEKLKAARAVAVKEVKKEQPPVTGDEYWTAVLKEKAGLSSQVENMRSGLNTLKINNEQLERDLNNLTREKQELEKQVSYNQKTLDNMAAELVIRRNAERQSQDNSKYLKNENTALRRQLKSLSNRKADLEKKFVQIQEEKSRLESRLNETAVLLEDRLSNMSDLKQQLDLGTVSSRGQVEKQTAQPETGSVELPSIVVHPQAQGETSAWQKKRTPIQPIGTVLEIDKENGFVIIDLGQDAGIKPGDTFKVYKQGNPIATIEVIRARQTICACNIKEEIMPIEVGDDIVK